MSCKIMATEDPISPENPNRSPKKRPENGDWIFSPRFRSVAAMAGWDEEALLIASFVIEDTPDRDNKHKRQPDLRFKTPPTDSRRRKRRAQRKSPVLMPVAVLNLEEDDETCREESLQNKEEQKMVENGELNKPAVDSCSSSCMDKLREELSCAICLDICYEPSTTTCGHSFCEKCLKAAADKCGKRCPKCRQLISNGRSCTVNTVLWNTIQLLFPQEVEARKASSVPSRSPPVRVGRNRTIQALNSPEGESMSLERRNNSIRVNQNRTTQALNSPEGEYLNLGRRRRNNSIRVNQNRTIQALHSPEGEDLNLERRRDNPIRVNQNRTIQALNSSEGEDLNLERRRRNQRLRNPSVRSTMLTRVMHWL